ncbi:MAG: acetyl-CoA carboxylase biotin carboxyl carrier protein subunit [Candidatus Marinimicrobia bacterium]|nr:acetyl-CoA carboxylase biotin carboxyl carrier protein subunit [Candidatus Neomarinimicrobiota bacterium]
MKFQAIINENIVEFCVEPQDYGFKVAFTDSTQQIDCKRLSPYSYSLLINGKSYYLSLTQKNGGYRITLNQQSFTVHLKDETQILLDKFGLNKSAEGSSQNIISPIPGLVKQIFVQPGEQVTKGTKLLILEAMKMENEIIAVKTGTIVEIMVKQGQSKNKGDLLVRIEGE